MQRVRECNQANQAFKGKRMRVAGDERFFSINARFFKLFGRNTFDRL